MKVVHISVGELLRKQKDQPDVHARIGSAMKNGDLVPYYLICNTLNSCLKEHIKNGQKNFLIDGFPRSQEQNKFFNGKESIL